MTDHKMIIAAIACALVMATPAAGAQTASIDWQGEDSEFGSIRSPFAATMEGDRVPVEARVVLRENYEDQDSRFFMFGFLTEGTPLDVNFENIVRMDTGEELPCYKREGNAKDGIKCFVDLKDMPPVGTEIRMYGTAGSERQGNFNFGAMVMAFTYTWTNVQMSNGLIAQLYAGTQINVVDCPGKCGGLGGDGNGILAQIPGPGLLGVLAAGAAAVGVATLRRRK